MRSWFTIAVTSVFLSAAGMAVAFNPITDLASDPSEEQVSYPTASAPCPDPDGDQACNQFNPATGFHADGEWNPVLQVVAFLATSERVITIPVGGADPACGGAPSFFNLAGGTGQAQRGFCWSTDPAAGDFYTSSWIVGGGTTARIKHYDPAGTFIEEFIPPIDPATGSDMQISGLGMDYANGHMWGILRNNNPSGGPAPVSRLVEFEFVAGAPVLKQGPLDMPWNGGPSDRSSAGLEYNNSDCTIVALRQDALNSGGESTELTVVQDNVPAGVGGVSFLGFCGIPNNPCSGGGPGVNRPWGIAVVEDAPLRVIFSDLNIGPGPPPNCATISQPGDFHITNLPPVAGACISTAVEPSTWGRIKSNYAR